jgi:hypothetical protein
MTTLVEIDNPGIRSTFTSAVSLHAHTNRSREVMTPVRPYLERIPVIASLVRRQMREYERRNGEPVDFGRGWWQPPLDPHEVLASEASQIEDTLGLCSIVSITDHDNIDAPLALLSASPQSLVPISLEWTAPFRQSFFHIGVHNLAPASAIDTFNALAAYTAKPAPGQLAELFALLQADPAVLVVLNHPLWDLQGIGTAEHAALLTAFIDAHAAHIHAIEINGYRAWRENLAAIQLATDCGLPVVSGGDRHGCVPNGLLNLTRATTFADFAAEVRERRASTIVVMPDYHRALVDRKVCVAADAMRDYPQRPPGQQHWTGRVFYERRGTTHPIAQAWPGGGPVWVRCAMRAFEFAASPPMQPVLRRIVRLAGASTSDRADPLPVPAVTRRVAKRDPSYTP